MLFNPLRSHPLSACFRAYILLPIRRIWTTKLPARLPAPFVATHPPWIPPALLLLRALLNQNRGLIDRPPTAPDLNELVLVADSWEVRMITGIQGMFPTQSIFFISSIN